MRCYACDRQNASHHDGATGRDYCTHCWNIIEDTIGLVDDEGLTDTSRHVTLEDVVLDSEDISSAIREASSYSSDMP